jgi:hypothetical protein
LGNSFASAFLSNIGQNSKIVSPLASPSAIVDPCFW